MSPPYKASIKCRIFCMAFLKKDTKKLYLCRDMPLVSIRLSISEYNVKQGINTVHVCGMKYLKKKKKETQEEDIPPRSS